MFELPPILNFSLLLIMLASCLCYCRIRGTKGAVSRMDVTTRVVCGSKEEGEKCNANLAGSGCMHAAARDILRVPLLMDQMDEHDTAPFFFELAMLALHVFGRLNDLPVVLKEVP